MPTALGTTELNEDLEDPRWLVSAGLAAERAGRVESARDLYTAALESGPEMAAAVRSEAVRRLAVIHNLRGEVEVAREKAQQAYEIAMRAGAMREGAEALNALAGFAFETGDLTVSTRYYGQARDLAINDPDLLLRIDHNLGILANVRGEQIQAAAHFQIALMAAERAGDARQVAMAHHNLGMGCLDLGQDALAKEHFEVALLGALSLGDRHLEGLCRLNLAETHLVQGRAGLAKGDAEEALDIFERLDSRRDKGAANRILGIIARETDRPSLAESRFASAIQVARSTSCPLSEAEARRDLGILYQNLGRRAEAFVQFEKAHSLFESVEARRDQETVRRLLSVLQAGEHGGAADRRQGSYSG